MRNILDWIEEKKQQYESPGPRNMAQAPIAEDLEPGSLRDEMLKGFDPSQETHEEYLQRINLERPFNAAQGGFAGQLVQNTVDGSRPWYGGSKERNKGAKFFYKTTYDEILKMPISQERTNMLAHINQRIIDGKFVPSIPVKERAQIAVDKRLIEDKKKFFKTDKGKQLKWVADKGKNYSSSDKMVKDFLKEFKIKNLKNSAIFKGVIPSPKDGNLTIGLNMLKGEKYNIIGAQTKRSPTNILNAFNYKAGNESNLFKLSILQNNQKVSIDLKNAFESMSKDHSILKKESRLLGVDDALKTLNKKEYQVLKNFGFIKSGIGSGAINKTLRRNGMTDEQLFNFQEIRTPIMHTNNIITSLKYDSGRKAFNLSKAEADKVIRGWDKVSSGFDDANAFVKKMDNYLGEGKFKKVFGNTTFDHVLAKEFGKQYKTLPKDLLLKGKYTTSAFNQLKLKTFDKPLLSLVKKYNMATGDNKKIIGQQIQNLYNDFNARTNNYLKDFKPEFKEKVNFKFSKPAFSDVGRYEKSTLAAKEIGSTLTMKNLTEGTGKYNYSKEQLNLFNKHQNKVEKFLNTASKTFQDLSQRSIAQLAKEHGCKKFNEGGSFITCLTKKFNANPEKFLQKSVPLAKDNMNLYKWFKNGRKIARGTGILLAWEAAFAPIVGAWSGLEGESIPRIINDIAYGIPGIGEKKKDEWMKYAGGDELAYKMKRMGELENQEIPQLEYERDVAINKTANVPKLPGREGKGYQQLLIEKDIKEKKLELQELYNTPEFYEGPVGSYYNEPVIQDAFALEQLTTKKIAADIAARKKQRWESYVPWSSQLQMAGGGMVGIRKPSAIAPTGGPMSQGLRSLYINDKDY